MPNMFLLLISRISIVADNLTEQILHLNRQARSFKLNHLLTNRQKGYQKKKKKKNKQNNFDSQNPLTSNMKGTFIVQMTFSSKVSRLLRCLFLKEDACLIHGHQFGRHETKYFKACDWLTPAFPRRKQGK